MKTFIIGNGSSRSHYDLNDLFPRGIVWGCNALYRQFAPEYKLPHFLVAIDDAIITEIEYSTFPSNRFIVPPENEKWEPVELHWGRSADPNWNPTRPRSNAGMNAMREAIKLGHDDLYIMGFDFLVVDQEQAMSNMFDGTPCYGPETRANVEDTRKRLNYFGWVIENNPNVTFNLVFNKNTQIYMPEATNVNLVDYESL